MALQSAGWDAVHAAVPAGSYRLAGRTISHAALAGAALALALAVLVPRQAWRIGRLVVTAVHEGGHAVAAVLVGRKVSAVHLRANTSGVTFHTGPAGRTRRVATAIAGYPAPGLVAVAGAFAMTHGQLGVWLLALLVLAVINVVLWVRNLFGILLMAIGVAALGWLIVNGTPGAAALVGMVVVWYLAIGGLRASAELWGDGSASDAVEVGRLLHLPAAICKVGFVVSTGAATALVGALLLRSW